MTECNELKKAPCCEVQNFSVENSLICVACQQTYHIGCLTSDVPSPILGDLFFNLTCSHCSSTSQDVFERNNLQWLHVVLMALYNLQLSGYGKRGYFKWKDDICPYIQKHWNIFFSNTNKKKTSLWRGTVAGVLSNGSPHFFTSGYEDLKEHGWWKLTNLKAPMSILEEHRQRKLQTVPETEIHEKVNPSTQNIKGQNDKNLSSSFIPHSCKDDILNNHGISNSQDHTCGAGSHLAIEDSASKIVTAYNEWSHSEDKSDSLSNSTDLSSVTRDKICEDVKDLDDFLSCDSDALMDVDIDMSNINDDIVSSFLPSVDEIITSSLRFNDESEMSSELAESGNSRVTESVSIKDIKPERPDPQLFRPVSLYEENSLLQKLNARNNILTPRLKRLRRKLILRKEKREYCQPVFDLDMLANGVFPPVQAKLHSMPTQISIRELSSQYNIPSSYRMKYDHAILDKFQSKYISEEDKGLSFYTRLAGRNDSDLKPICSPYTMRLLKPFIRRDCDTKPLKLRLLQEIIAYPHRNDPTYTPSASAPIDYCYVRPNHIPAINALCRQFFWPEIDLSESLFYPDFSCVVLYRKLVIGFAFMVPDLLEARLNEAYISFLFTHPEWRGSGIGSFMIYHLLQTCMSKDVTLHVSVNNPAMLLYHKFGFKPEKYIRNFYDKYYPSDSMQCMDAMFLRLQR